MIMNNGNNKFTYTLPLSFVDHLPLFPPPLTLRLAVFWFLLAPPWFLLLFLFFRRSSSSISTTSYITVGSFLVSIGSSLVSPVVLVLSLVLPDFPTTFVSIVTSVCFSTFSHLLYGHTRDILQSFGSLSSSFLDNSSSLQLLVFTSPGRGPPDHVGLGLGLVESHRLVVDVEFGGAISSNVDNSTARVDLVLAEFTVSGSDNHKG